MKNLSFAFTTTFVRAVTTLSVVIFLFTTQSATATITIFQLVGDFIMRGVLELTPVGFALRAGELGDVVEGQHGARVDDVRWVDASRPWGRTRLVAAVLTGRLGRSRVYHEERVKEHELDLFSLMEMLPRPETIENQVGVLLTKGPQRVSPFMIPMMISNTTGSHATRGSADCCANTSINPASSIRSFQS